MQGAGSGTSKRVNEAFLKRRGFFFKSALENSKRLMTFAFVSISFHSPQSVF